MYASVEERGAVSKWFIPCIGGRCPGQMGLIIRRADGSFVEHEYYRCDRTDGFECRYSRDDIAQAECRVGEDINVERWLRIQEGKVTKDSAL